MTFKQPPSESSQHPDSNISGSNSPDFRVLPAVDRLAREVRTVNDPELSDAIVSAIVADVLSDARSEIAAGAVLTRDVVVDRARSAVHCLSLPRLHRLINATGIIVHTNLGRAPLSDEASEAMVEAASSYVPLELEPETNQRGGRMEEISRLMRLLTGAEETLVVNNNAAAVLVALSAIASRKEVIVSRGEAVEIGGGFRIPDVLRQSGARLVEVGTTNRTNITDYERAISTETAALLKVHQSNFRIVGFTSAPPLAEMVALGNRHDVPVLEDLGSGALFDTARYGLDHEPTIQESVAAGVSVVMGSGDKLLGGPQAGLMLGEQRWIERIAAHPLARAVRADKTCLAALAATLRHYVRGDAESRIPVRRMMHASIEELDGRARAICRELGDVRAAVTVVASEASVGGGALPGQTLPSRALRLTPSGMINADELARRLRVSSRPPIYGRIVNDGLQLDLRTVLPEQDAELRDSLDALLPLAKS